MTDTRKTILARRARFIAAAIASAGVAAACGGEATSSSVCLQPLHTGDGGTDAGQEASDAPVNEVIVIDVTADPKPCNAPDVSHEAQVCLEPIPPDADPDTDADPQVCLKIAPDAGDDTDAGPDVCLSPK